MEQKQALRTLVFENLPREIIREEEPLARHTSFRIGGPAELMVFPRNRNELQAVLRCAAEAGVTPRILGAGTNVLAPDEGVRGLVICLRDTFMGLTLLDGARIEAMSGMTLAKTAMFAARNGLSGLEFAHGIPGTVGGAIYMNAGAYGGEIKDVLACATFLDETGEERTLQAGELQLGYRTSVFEREPWCILSATFTLREDDTGPIRERMADYARRRMEKQPLDMPSAGSTFKRPEGAYAGALIDQCGLRGYAIGGAQVSQKHCGFIVNTGNATCADVLCLADTVCKIVTDETGFRLEKEVRVVK